jgi:uncharacterized repeat protein (TIGR03803 family)
MEGHRLLIPIIIFGALLPIGRCAAQAPFATIYTFDDQANGLDPQGLLALNGTLYGTAAGGVYNAGVVFALQPPAVPSSPRTSWTETVVYDFTGQDGDGSAPAGPPASGPGNALYGTTYGGGPEEYGTAYSLAPPGQPGGAWTETVLYQFTQFEEGEYPQGELAIGKDGRMYGVTFGGGPKDAGVAFELIPPPAGSASGAPWTERVIHRFDDRDGHPPNGLVMGADGVLYGSASLGGTNDAGTIFELSPPAAEDSSGDWTYTVLRSFTGGMRGVYPFVPPTVAPDGTLFGITGGYIMPDGYPGVEGLETVFSLAPRGSGRLAPWKETVLATFGHGDLLGYSSTVLYHDGKIFGAAAARNMGGEFFELTPPSSGSGPWTKVILHVFPSGYTPAGNLTMDETGAIYGMTINPSDPFGNSPPATIYRIVP